MTGFPASRVDQRSWELHSIDASSFTISGVIAFDDPGTDSYDMTGDTQGSRGDRGDPWDLFERSRFSTETPIHIEAPFEITVGDGSIRGKIDAVYDSGDRNWEIVDYKSGTHRDDASRRVQLEAYALAAADGALSAQPPEAISVTFAYFGGSEIVEVNEAVDDEWMGEARSHVERLVDQGINGPFDPTPSDDCRWCDFLHLCPAGQQHQAKP